MEAVTRALSAPVHPTCHTCHQGQQGPSFTSPVPPRPCTRWPILRPIRQHDELLLLAAAVCTGAAHKLLLSVEPQCTAQSMTQRHSMTSQGSGVCHPLMSLLVGARGASGCTGCLYVYLRRLSRLTYLPCRDTSSPGVHQKGLRFAEPLCQLAGPLQ